VNVRIDPTAHARLTEVARAEHIPLSEALSRAIESYRREKLIQKMSADYAAMRANPEAWAEESAERALWDRSGLDGREDEPAYPPGVATTVRKRGASLKKRERRRR